MPITPISTYRKTGRSTDHCGSGNSDVDHIVALFRSHTVTETDNYGDIANASTTIKRGRNVNTKSWKKLLMSACLTGLIYQAELSDSFTVKAPGHRPARSNQESGILSGNSAARRMSGLL